MSTNASSPPIRAEPDCGAEQTGAASPAFQSRRLKRLGIWALFLAVLWLTRDFFFIAFMTFLFSYTTLNVADMILKRSSAPESPRRRRLVTVAVFLMIPLLLVLIGWFLGPALF